MGNSPSSEIDKNSKILKTDKPLKLLLLGCGGAGKSTFFKQVKIITDNLDPELVQDNIVTVYGNILEAMIKLIWICEDKKLQFDNEENIVILTFFLKLLESS